LSKNIAFVSLGFRPYRTSGFDLAGERLVDALANLGNTVTVFACRKKGVTELANHSNIKIHRIGLDHTDWFGFAFRAGRFLSKSSEFDVVHFYDISFSYSFKGDFVASLQHSFRQRLESLALQAEGITARKSAYYIYYFLTKKMIEEPSIRRARGFLASSATSKNEYQQYYDIPSNKVVLARHCVDTNLFRPFDAEASELRATLGLSVDDPVILFVGFITPRKGIEYLFQAMPLIKPRPKLVLVGKWHSKAYRQKLMIFLESMKDDIIEAGFVPDEDLPVYYSMSDLYVTASLMEGFGIPIAEALACERPVVAVDSGAAAEVLGPGGKLVPPKDVKAMAQAVSDLLADRTLRKRMGSLGRKNVKDNFSVASMLDGTLEAYDRFL
jgi:glycosyltransferase involved in cell wall biosynthesis